MAKIVIRCRYTGNYVFTGIDTDNAPTVVGGRIFCPYCAAEHVWSAREAHADEHRSKPLVRQAS